MAKDKKVTIEKLAEMVAGGFANTATKDDISALKLEIRENTKRLSKIEAWMETVDERLDEIEKRLDRIEYSLLKQQEKRIERLESELDRVKKLLPAQI